MELFFSGWDVYRLSCISALSSSACVEGGLQVIDEDEVQDRLGLVEEYLSAWDALQWKLLRSTARVCRRERERLVANEAAERRLIEGDSAFLPYKPFPGAMLSDAFHPLLVHESEARQRIFQEYTDCFSTNLFNAYEALRRMGVTYEALDSLVIKACHVGRAGQREGLLAHTSTSGHAFESPHLDRLAPIFPNSMTNTLCSATVSLLVGQEKEERCLLDATRRNFMDSAKAVRAVYEEQYARLKDSLTLTTEASMVSAP
ncbi:hypothetical protein ABB37_04485 [Leptomonas pyrrhocoris]|uniref:Uncharacterized protein n=1 Tax=Leptomonas pyrrhocoris TaxID=157538 RepID=A0A0N0DW16_LEPPY|nr:hypothetical protein ABB37_04485 [Leptomonas pyrrhocoris]XP_015659581.1 hypothetical protein ABB37_04485 [Leptomonas pyrrhocoris]KPA81141.1 hypothetical protein ABB37_04485 [Leptomonas pyrrhocoris]KPA81142.1 hypothetical protein ABB37_04485 [Leptomonas pyrrhocoris]|eukprot:XP_015659580.1 hypothetical protein ABB37_04485 [Leptomonas pyrrhocoris]